MYSVKPGRGPSAFGAVGAVIALVFGIFWTVTASRAGAPGIFVLFGVVFMLAAVAGGIYNLFNAVAPNRASEYDIVRTSAEPDPLAPAPSSAPGYPIAGGYCPFCGNALSPEFQFCPKCGKAVRRAT
jgi:hypothetical protein